MPFIQSAIPLFQSINQSINLLSNHQPLHFFNNNRFLFPLPHPLLLDNRRPSWPVNETIGRQKGLHCAWDPRKGEKTAPQTGQSTNRPTGVNRNDMGVRASILWFNLHLFFPLYFFTFHLCSVFVFTLSYLDLSCAILFCFVFVLFCLFYRWPIINYLVLILSCFYFALSCFVLSQLVLPCFVLPCLVLFYLVLSCHFILSCFVLSLSCFLPYVTYFLSCHFCLFFFVISTCFDLFISPSYFN